MKNGYVWHANRKAWYKTGARVRTTVTGTHHTAGKSGWTEMVA